MIRTEIQLKCRNEEDPLVMVDDNEIDLDIARRFKKFSRLKNPFVGINTGAAFVEYMTQVSLGEAAMPALVLMDINMPGLDGFEVVSMMRDESQFREVPIVLMHTHSDSHRDMERALEAGANGFLTKGMSLKEYVSFFDSLCHDA